MKLFIAIEGLDCSGKSTVTKLLAERLRAQAFKFPAYDTPVGQLIAAHLHKEWCAIPLTAGYREAADSKLVDALMFQALQTTNRLEMLPQLNAALARNTVVVADRYWPSGYAYGAADGLDAEYLIRLHSSLPQPNLHVLLDIPPEVALRRRPELRDRYENLGQLTRVAANYKTLWERYAKDGTWLTVDAQQTPEEIVEHLQEKVLKLLHPA